MKISLCLASIRSNNLLKVYNSAKESCKRYEWEMVISSPFLLPQEINFPNVKFVRDYGCPTRATQIGLSLCQGEYVTFPADDGVFLPDALDAAIDFMQGKSEKDGMVMRYKEGNNYMDNPDAPSFPDSYWNANTHLNPPGWKSHWKIAPQPMFRTSYLVNELGGFSTEYECMSFSTWQVCGRAQKNGSVFHLSPLEIQRADNYGTTGLDHAPIYNAHKKDHDLFMSSDLKIKIDFNNWKNSPEVWEKRFSKKKYETYDEMMSDLSS